MKVRVITIILSVLLLIAIAYVVFVTIVANEAIDGWSVKYDEVVGKYSDAIENYKELYEKYKNEIAEKMAIPAPASAIANLIDEDSLITVFDERVIHITVPYTTDIKDTVEGYVAMIPSLISVYGYESCIISVVDETGKCVCGWTIYETGDTDTFMSESFVIK